MVIFIDETTVELQNDLPEFDAFPIKLGTWILCFSCVFQIEILHIKTCIQQKLPTIFHQHIPKFLDYQWAIQVSSPWVGFAGHKRASLQLRKTYGTWVLGLAYHGFQLDLVMWSRSEVLWRERRCWSEGDLRVFFLMTRNETCLETASFFLVVDNTTLFCWQKIPYSLLKLSLFH